MTLLLALACAPAPEGTDPTSPTLSGTTEPAVLTDTEAPWLDEATTEAVTVDLDAVASVVDDAIVQFLDLDPAPIITAYRDLMTGASAGCPDYYQDASGYWYWLDSCTAQGGTAYDGYGVDYLEAGVDLGDGVYGDILTLGGVGNLDGGGTTFDFNGYVQVVTGSDPTGFVNVEQVLITGDFDTNDPVASGTWLGEGLRPNATVLRYGITGTGGATVVSGVLEGLPGDYPAVVFDEAVIADPLVGMTDCADEPSGSASVQLPTGQWVDIVFDPRFDGETIQTDPGTCDGCGTAWYRTENLGQICFDFSAWLR